MNANTQPYIELPCASSAKLQGSSYWTYLVVFLYFASTAALCLWLYLTDYTAAGGEPLPVQRTALGTVLRVSYVGSLGIDTQVETQVHTVLLSGIAHIKRTTAMELQMRHGRARVCVVGTETCWEAKGY